MTDVTRCWWPGDDPLYLDYHDNEWGVPVYDDAALFERLMLEGFQAGLSWITILRRREQFAAAFDDWDAEKIAAYGDDDIARLMNDAGIIRNRLKVNGAVKNAKAYLAIREETGSFSDYLWAFVGGKPIINQVTGAGDSPVFDDNAMAMSRALKKRGMTFVGPTICYAFMQSVGMVDDHVVGCISKTG